MQYTLSSNIGSRTFSTGIAVFSIAVFASVQLSVSSRLQSSLRTQKIPTGMLDYGEKGKILKSLGFVYPVQNDYTRYKPNNSMPARIEPAAFEMLMHRDMANVASELKE